MLHPASTCKRLRREVGTGIVAALLLSVAAAPIPVVAETSDESLFAPESVMPVSRDEFETVLEHHRGKVLLVNLWATWCIPCIQELPEIDELQHRYRDRGLEVLAVSLDDPADLEEKVDPFFAEKAPRLVSYLQTEEDPFTFVALLDEEWVGSLPTSFFIDRQGKIRKAITGRLTYSVFEENVLPLLEEEP